MKHVILKVIGGIVDPVSIPNGIEVIIHDYDMGDAVKNELIHTDKNGEEFVEIIFDETEYV
jgi:hypothetical protein